MKDNNEQKFPELPQLTSEFDSLILDSHVNLEKFSQSLMKTHQDWEKRFNNKSH